MIDKINIILPVRVDDVTSNYLKCVPVSDLPRRNEFWQIAHDGGPIYQRVVRVYWSAAGVPEVHLSTIMIREDGGGFLHTPAPSVWGTNGESIVKKLETNGWELVM